MITLVLCVDRTNDIGRKIGFLTSVADWEAARSLVTDVGLSDPEDSSINYLPTALRTARELKDKREDARIAVTSGTSDSAVRADHAVARQLDGLAERFDVESVVVIIDSAGNERLVPVVENRLRVDAVDRVVAWQAHDIESTYYLLRQFLGDKELCLTVLVPLGVGPLFIPLLLIQFGPEAAMAGLTALMGAVLLYEGLVIDEFLSDARDQIRDALYSGQVSVVAYAVAAKLAIVRLFLGILAIRFPGVDGGEEVLVPSLLFAYHSAPRMALAALIASAGHLLDELTEGECVSTSYTNLPFDVAAIGFVVHGFVGFFPEWQGELANLELLGRLTLTPIQRLAVFTVTSIVVSVVDVHVSASVSGETLEDVTDTPGEDKS